MRIEVELEIHGDEVTVDLSGSAPMVRGALNSTRSFTEATVYQAVMSAVSSEIPTTSGAFRPVKVVTKPGTVAHVVMPAASTMRGVTGFRMFDAVNGALAQLIPHRVPGGRGGRQLARDLRRRRRPDGEPFIYFELVVGTWGARPTADGNDGLCNPAATAANIPVEVAESEFPIMIERYGLVPDSGGPGRYRGGLAIERTWRTLAPDTTLQVRSDRQNHAPYGLYGGLPGGFSANGVTNGSGPRAYPPMFSTTIGERRRLPPPHGRRRRLGRPARARPGGGGRRRAQREGRRASGRRGLRRRARDGRLRRRGGDRRAARGDPGSAMSRPRRPPDPAEVERLARSTGSGSSRARPRSCCR